MTYELLVLTTGALKSSSTIIVGEDFMDGRSLRTDYRNSGIRLREVTHCPQGHEYTVENTYYQTKRDRGTVGRKSRVCKQCSKERMQRKRLDPKFQEQGRQRTALWRKRHPEKYRAGYTRSHSEKKRIIDEARSGGCSRCEESDLACLDFHHRDRATKDMDAAGMRRFSRDRMLAEIAKCDVLCANCHRKHHRDERQS